MPQGWVGRSAGEGCRGAWGLLRRLLACKVALTLCAIVSAHADPSDSYAQQTLPGQHLRQTDLLPDEPFTLPIEASWGSPRWAVAAPAPVSCQAAADLDAGKRLERGRNEACVDFYYRAALQAWSDLERSACPSVVDAEYCIAFSVYQEALARLVAAASRFGRLDPRARLVVNTSAGRRTIAVRHHGFAWRPCDFCCLQSACEFRRGDVKWYYRAPGLGASLIAIRTAACEEPFFRTSQPFAATAVLRPTMTSPQAQHATQNVTGTTVPEATLELFNPYVIDSLPLGSAAAPMERDLSAPFVYVAEQTPRTYLEGFIEPGDTDVEPKLFFMEPYQRGKIPVVFIHGLLSDPMTWLDAVNDLRAQPDLYRRYQFWYFRYPTGDEVLESAAKLREQLLLARATFDPACQDDAMNRVVLIGHSMGGLMARLQVTYAYDILWRHAARAPLDAVVATPEMRNRLERSFFFDPSPLVTRVVYIGTPHRGAGMARRLVGRFASSLVQAPADDEPAYRQLMDQNRDVFYDYLQDSPPTSIDLLEPDNPLLNALAQMPFRPGLRMHTILGTGGSVLEGEPGDGVVPVSSARLAGVCSELLVPARHSDLHRDAAAVAELQRILRVHAQ
ncbi:MAG: esterase/lipase family protein [Planctomycetota bacterium]